MCGKGGATLQFGGIGGPEHLERMLNQALVLGVPTPAASNHNSIGSRRGSGGSSGSPKQTDSVLELGQQQQQAITLPATGQSPAKHAAHHQAKLLRHINGLNTKEDVLNYVAHNHHLLDSINLVTCLYRLARIYTNLQDHKASWKAQLLSHDSFAILLGAIHVQLSQAQALVSTQADVPTGLNARCLANLVWSLVKLEAACEEGHPLALQVVAAASPLVLYNVNGCSGQGLANLLWSYAKVPVCYQDVMTAVLMRMVHLMKEPTGAPGGMDAQALSNSIWVIAHIRSQPKPNVFEELEASASWQSAVTLFLFLMANQSMAMLSQLVDNPQEPRLQPQVVDHEQAFSCQAIVNIAWSFSTILGSACGVESPMCPLFLFIRELMIGKLRASVGGLHLHMPWVYSLSGTFNEQSLCNLVAAFDNAGLLNTELLQAVLDVATLRLARGVPGNGSHGGLPFRATELCVLLRACHTGLAEPWAFLTALSRLIAQHPLATANWNSTDAAELARAMQLLRTHAAMEAIQQQQQPRQVQAQAPLLQYTLLQPNSTPQPQYTLLQQPMQVSNHVGSLNAIYNTAPAAINTQLYNQYTTQQSNTMPSNLASMVLQRSAALQNGYVPQRSASPQSLPDAMLLQSQPHQLLMSNLMPTHNGQRLQMNLNSNAQTATNGYLRPTLSLSAVTKAPSLLQPMGSDGVAMQQGLLYTDRGPALSADCPVYCNSVTSQLADDQLRFVWQG